MFVCSECSGDRERCFLEPILFAVGVGDPVVHIGDGRIGFCEGCFESLP
jgi:hypothetical protein